MNVISKYDILPSVMDFDKYVHLTTYLRTSFVITLSIVVSVTTRSLMVGGGQCEYYTLREFDLLIRAEEINTRLNTEGFFTEAFKRSCMLANEVSVVHVEDYSTHSVLMRPHVIFSAGKFSCSYDQFAVFQPTVGTRDIFSSSST